MTSRDVKQYIEKEGMNKLYKKFDKYFKEVDKIADEFATGDLLDEYQLSHSLDRLTGIYARFHVIAGAIDSYKKNKELDFVVKRFDEARANDEKINVSQIEKEARASTKDLREYRSDFLNYSESAEKAIVTCQARLKRLTVEKSAKGIDFTGDTSNESKQGW